ncbi:MAG TPA: hypothetical protein VES97_01050 [Solirubrobacteraceae bacterium]|nr:hypothetical protein [Solirubrobacteraceae bacterium]
MTMTIIPADDVPRLREALYGQLGDVAEGLASVTRTPGRGVHSEWAEPMTRFDLNRALLDQVGWNDRDPEQDAEIDLDIHWETIETALRWDLDTYRRLADTTDAPQRERATANIAAIERLLSELQGARRMTVPGESREQAAASAPVTVPLLLAAIERAERHRARDTPDVPMWAILDHLDIARRSGRARSVRSTLGDLEAARMLVRSRRHGVAMWALTRAGRQRLRRAEPAPQLPESPQHRAWRQAHTAAETRIDGFSEAVGEAALKTFLLLDAADGTVNSDAWFELGEQLGQAAWRLGSAIHCLHEWPEPSDEQPDIDDRQEPTDQGLDLAARRRRRWRRDGRRDIRRWK